MLRLVSQGCRLVVIDSSLVNGVHLATELLDVLGELAMLASIVDESTDVFLIAFAAQSHVSPLVVLPRLAGACLKDLRTAVSALV